VDGAGEGGEGILETRTVEHLDNKLIVGVPYCLSLAC